MKTYEVFQIDENDNVYISQPVLANNVAEAMEIFVQMIQCFSSEKARIVVKVPNTQVVVEFNIRLVDFESF